MAKFCTNCGNSLPDEIAFCTECGAKVTENIPQTTPEQPVKAVEQTAHETVQDTPPQMPPQQAQAAVQTPIQQPVYQAVPQQQYQQPYQAPYPPPAQTRELTAADVKGTKYEPITAGGFIGIMLLMCIPVLGLLLTIIWACGGCRKISKRSYARASLIMTIIATVLVLILVLVGGALINTLFNKLGIEFTDNGGLFSGFLAVEEKEDEPSNALSGLFGGMSGSGGTGYDELDEALSALEALSGLTGGTSDLSGLEGLIGSIDDMNRDAAESSDGWPNSLREYPGGSVDSVTSYRTEISDTSAEEMHEWIDSIKRDGYSYQDFYGFGMSEDDMLAFDGWWGTNGVYYISVSYYDGTVVIDHVNELPNLEDYFS